ncbi:pheromone processing endoprotease [Actinomortierella ambigua]|nr:pheromone processing endoprotease [Actinomortierella ambigua]
MKPTLFLLSAIALAASSSLVSNVASAAPASSQQVDTRPHVYAHDDHHYYTIQVRDLTATTPQELAESLGIEHVGQVGELQNYHLFRSPKSALEKRVSDFSPLHGAHADRAAAVDEEEDIVVQRYHAFKRSFWQHALNKRDGEYQDGDEHHPLGAIEKQVLRRRIKRVLPWVPRQDQQAQAPPQTSDQVAGLFGITDPGFKNQWHLYNGVQAKHDINITGVWAQGITGKGATVAIIDDGLDVTSEDLKPNFFAAGSYDFNDGGAIPMPRLDDDNHGTRCAGEIASVRNDLCGVGVAWDAKVAGIRILSGEITNAQEAEAINYKFQENQIYSCSWGPKDDGIAMDGPRGVLLDAFINGVTNGRNGLGSIFVFATGNGGRAGDNCNFDGYTNSRYTISIGAITRDNQHPIYSEACSAQLAVTYSSGDNSWIYTCDVGKRNCFDRHSGTSAAAPIAAGIYALALEANPKLNWRDIQHITVQTAIPINEDDPDWTETYAGRLFNHRYGYGSMDAYAIVEAAKNWVSVGPQVNYESPVVKVDGEIPHGTVGLESIINVSKDDLDKIKFGRLEHVTVTLNIEHQSRGDVAVHLKSPNGIISELGVSRPNDASKDGFVDWTFMSVKHWDEPPVGPWTLMVFDSRDINATGIFKDWKLGLHGETIQADGPPNGGAPAPHPPPTTPEKQPLESDGKSKDTDKATKVSPFIYVMFGGMFVAIGAALVVMYRQRQNPKSVFRNMSDEEAGQRGGLLGGHRRGEYEFDTLPTHDLGESDDDDEDDEDHHIIFDRSNMDEEDQSGGDQGLRAGKAVATAAAASVGASSKLRDTSSPFSSGEEVNDEDSSFERTAGAQPYEDDDDDNENDGHGGSRQPDTGLRSESWDDFSSLVKSKDARH